ncbi:hypothetical protein BGZ81_007911, partial [Podila clonocystis]
CKCKKAYDTCGSAFDPACNLTATKLYTCTAAGAAPTGGTDCANGCTVNAITAADTCNTTPPDCKCKKAYDTCGSAFDPACNLTATKLYTCTAAGAAPTGGTNCTNGCTVNAITAADTCKPTPPDCKCKEAFLTCGSAFDPLCQKDNNTLYTCSAVGADPVLKQACNGACVPVVGKDDECLCGCKEGNTTVCADTFPPECKFTNGTLLTCSAINAVPTVLQNCTVGCLVQTGPDICKPDPCACQKAGDSCSSSFPANCSYEANTLYTCTGKDATPVKKAPCLSTEICTIVAGGNDFCATNPTCACVGNGTLCGSDFPPNCTKTPSSVYTCPAGTETPCPNGCANGVCKDAGCLCTVDGNVCGSTFAKDCNLQPNAIYKCVKGQPPQLDSNCGSKACVGGACQDPCLCKGSNKVCGSTFPPSCNFTSTALYTCTAAGATPSAPKNCTAGCELTQPDNRCANPCVQQAKDATAAINTVVQSLTTILGQTGADNVSSSELPVFIKLFTDLATNLTSATNDEVALTAIAYSARYTANATFLILQSALNQSLFQNATRDLLLPVNATQRNQVITLLTALVTCTNSTTKDCTALNQLFQSFVVVANKVLSAYTTPVADQRAGASGTATATFTVQLASAVADITSAIATVNQTKLDASGLLLNKIIGLASNKKYGISSQALIFVYDSAGYAAACAGLNVTNWQDPCFAFGQRTQGFLADLIAMIQSFLGQVPIIGPMVVDPVLTQLRLLLVDAQTGIATAIGGVLSAIDAILSILSFGGASPGTDAIRDYILGIVGITNPPPQCAPKQGCQGVIMAFKMLLEAVYAIINNIPLIGPAAVGLLKPFTDAFLSGLNSATGATIAGLANTLITGIGTISTTLRNTFGLLPGFGTAIAKLADALDIIVKAAQDILNCYINNPGL